MVAVVTASRVAATLAIAAPICACRPALPAHLAPALVRFSTGTPGGGFYPHGEGLARAYERSLQAVTFQVNPTGLIVTHRPPPCRRMASVLC